LNIATNGGLTIVAVVRFTGTAADYERIIDLHESNLPNTTPIMIYRSETSSDVGLEIRNSWGTFSTRSSGEIVQGAWLTVVARYSASTMEYWFTVNNNVFTGNASTALTDRTVSNTWIARAFDAKPYFNGDIAGVFVVDEYLDAGATSGIADLMVRGVDLTADTSSAPAGSTSLTNCTCNAGFSGPDGGTCTACEAGKYKASTGSAVCTDCGAGTHSTAVGASASSTCSV
jgi:hypothetical protein